MFIVICFIMLVLGIVLITMGETRERKRKKNKGELFGYQFGGVIMVVFTIIILCLVWPLEYFLSITRVAEMEAFYNANRQNYETIVEQTSQAIIFLENESILQVSVENLKQSTNWSERLKELRDKATKYNDHFHRFKAYNENLLLDWFFKDLPENLKPVVLKLEEQ